MSFSNLFKNLNQKIIHQSIKAYFNLMRNDLNQYHHPFFIISIPGSLHLVDLCLQYVPANHNKIIVCNGLTNWERNWAQDHLQANSFIFLPRLLQHGHVLDLLINSFEEPFGILDYDCFVFNPSLFSRISQIDHQSILNAIFLYQNSSLNLDFPETFFLYLNPKVIKTIQRKYHVNSQRIDFDNLSNKVIEKLGQIGIDENHYPEEHKKYFDTIRLWYSLGIAEGYRCEFIDRLPTVSLPSRDIYHVGGVSNKIIVNSKWEYRGAYMWWRALEKCAYEDLKQFYQDKYGRFSSNDVIQKNPKYSIKPEHDFYNQIENITTRI